MMMLCTRIMAGFFSLLCDETQEAANERRKVIILSVLSFLAMC